jgi:hypothetical protein
MDFEFVLNVLDAVLIIGIAIPSLYIASRIPQKKLRLLTLLLAGFLVVHGLYHITAALGGVAGLEYFGTLADQVVEPLSWILFLSFAVYFARNS